MNPLRLVAMATKRFFVLGYNKGEKKIERILLK